nr:unnamed protein product [Digitaria exilis]
MHEWTYGSAFSWGRVDMVGTSNGLICLHDSSYGDRSTITIANPITGEALALPPVPRVRNSTGSFGSYGFGYHPTTGQYKVVHVPSCVSLRPDTVHVLTLGCSVWRKAVPSMADVTYYDCSGGVVCVDGSAYWFSLSGNRVVALDLKDERLTSFPGPPGMRSIGVASEASFKLTSVNARLGVVFPSYKPATTRVVVWILDGGGEEQPRWSRRYTLIDRTTGSLIVLTPHLTHGKDILTMSRDMDGLYRHKVGDCTDVDDGRTAQLVLSEGIELIISEEEGNIRTFAYVETQEPLPIIPQ